MPYTHFITVQPEDIDQMGHVNNVVYLRYAQETAEAHWKSFANQETQTDILWVVLRHEIDYKTPVMAGEVLSCETWVEEANGVKLPRIVSIKNKNNKVIANARTIWCALDGKTMRPKRIDAKLYSQFS